MPALRRGHFRFESGSYRDRDGRVFRDQGAVYRALSARALEEWEHVHRAPFFERAVAAGQIIGTTRDAELDASRFGSEWSAVLRHEAVPFISYPYEWCFGMLQDGALLQLELLLAALADGFTLKDGTAYNVQWRGSHPVFIDIPSFERLAEGRPWVGYRQFCQTMLFPLMLQAYKGVDFQPWLRGRLDGITPQECWNLMSFRDLFRRGVPAHVFLHAKLQSSAAIESTDTGRTLNAAGFNKAMIRNNAEQLLRIVRKLRWLPAQSTWSGYADCNSYSEADRVEKERFVRGVCAAQAWGTVWDLGCNTGTYSRIGAENAELVVALDADHLAIERLYQSLKGESDAASRRILPLVGSIVDQPAGLGWRGAERKSLLERGRPNLTLCLALIHHLVLSHGVPVDELIDWLAESRSELVIEYVAKDDPMIRRMLRGRIDNYADYEPDRFERLLEERFAIVRREQLPSGTRILYHAAPRGGA